MNMFPSSDVNKETKKTKTQYSNLQKKKKSLDKNRPIIGIGNNDNQNSNIVLKSVSKLAFLHVYKLHPETKVDDLREYLIQRFPEIQVEKLTSKYPEHYSSFKITLNESHLSDAMNPEIWPENTHVNRFFHSRKRPTTPS